MPLFISFLVVLGIPLVLILLKFAGGGAVEHLHTDDRVDLAHGPYRLCPRVSEAGGSASDKW